MSDQITASGLTKRFGDVTALDGLDLAVPESTVLGLLGPNGAGKTTAVSILTTLLDPDEGTATVAGIDVVNEPDKVRGVIGLSGQYAAVDEVLSGFENLDMIGRLYHMGAKAARARARELLDRFQLADAADRQVKTYSGGMRRRLDLAGALVARPPVLFLDEPTTGLDPPSRLELWGVIRELVADGTTLLLTTQYLEEADQLADDVMVIDQGRCIAEGTTDELKSQIGGDQVEIVVSDPARLDDAREILERLADGVIDIQRHQRRVTAPVANGADTLRSVLDELKQGDIEVHDVGLRRPTLDDVFLALTGHRAETPDADAKSGADTDTGAETDRGAS